jgi:hypothetical protein
MQHASIFPGILLLAVRSELPLTFVSVTELGALGEAAVFIGQPVLDRTNLPAISPTSALSTQRSGAG